MAKAHVVRGFPPSSLNLNHYFQILTSEKAFICLSLYNTVRLSMTLYFPSAISSLGEAKVSVSRIRDFLLMEERATEETSRAIHALNSKVRLGDIGYLCTNLLQYTMFLTLYNESTSGKC